MKRYINKIDAILTQLISQVCSQKASDKGSDTTFSCEAKLNSRMLKCKPTMQPLPDEQSVSDVRISSGCAFFDRMLNGGYEKDAITTIYGPAGSGKTNLAMVCAVACVDAGKKVIYIDTEGGFSVERLKQLCQDHKKVLDNILFLTPTTFEEQKKDIERLKTLVDQKIGVIIVDTISMLYRYERKLGDETSSEFNRDLSVQVAQLTEITRKKNIPVLLTNQVYSSFQTNGISMIGGDILKYGSKCLLEIIPFGGGRRKLVLRKHRSLPVDIELLFSIVSSGIDPV